MCIRESNNEQILRPSSFGFKKIEPNSISGGETVSESAEIFMSILSNSSSKEQKNVVAINSGLAISTATGLSIEDGIEKAKESIESGNAKKVFESLKKIK